MKQRLLFLLIAVSLSAHAQNWATFLDSSRAIDWTGAGFTIPNYTANCATQPALTANSSSAASANATAIQNALSSCDATHNVVNIPAGTYYAAGITFPSSGHVVLRGAGANSTKLISTSQTGCGGFNAGICMIDNSPVYNGSSQVLPGGSQQCAWSGGYAKGSTTITLTNCGSAPLVGHMLILDQANDSADTGGVYICDSATPSSCNYDGGGSINGRVFSGVTHSEQQTTYITSVTGSGPYTVTISPGVYNNNIRSSQNPGAWWSGITTLNGLENLTIDGTSDSYDTITMYDCYQCWAKGITALNGARASVGLYQSANDVIRDSYFYQAQGHTSVSYNIDPEESSAFLVENNIMQQTTEPIIINTGSGGVVDYNYAVDLIFESGWTWAAFSTHNAGDNFNMFEGNNWTGNWADDAWGSSATQTYFRNILTGSSSNGTTNGNLSIMLRSYNRGFNIVGNVLGQSGQSNQYQTSATSTTTGTGTAENGSIYSLGWAFINSCGTGTPSTSPSCDPLVVSTLMRWGNYDTVNGSTQWNSTEASPAAVPYISANFSSSYFSSVAHTLPASLYYNSTPSWWPTDKQWPPVGPDISSGNVGTCSGGSYSGAEATASSQCMGGTLSTAWASHVTSVPAQDCYLNVMHGPPDGTGGALSFNAAACYGSGSSSSTKPGSPTGFAGTVN